MVRLLAVDPQSPQPEAIRQAAALIRRGELVAFPTETVYGLGADALNPQAVARIFEVKGRPAHDPLIVHLATPDDLPRITSVVSPLARRLAETFWPGPLTLVLRKQPQVPDSVTAGLDTVAVRVPDHPVALALIRESNVPVAAPSANLFGRSSPTTARHVQEDLGDRLALILDAGPTMIGVESTVLDVTSSPPAILRPGGVTRESLEQVAGRVLLRNQELQVETPLPSPGLMAKHYAPRAELVLVLGDNDAYALEKMQELARRYLDVGIQPGLLLVDEEVLYFSGLDVQVFQLGRGKDLEQIARKLYAGLRALDDLGVKVILARCFEKRGLGLAINDRLRRAASRLVE